MKKNPDISPDAAELRRRAEQQLGGEQRNMIPGAEAARRLLHELQVHQIELEMQNDELRHTQMEAEAARARFSDFYEFAPIGYLTLEHDGTIREVNLTAAGFIGLERMKLLGRHFGFFVAPIHQPAFNAFLAKVFSSETKAVVEVALITADKRPLFAHIEAIADISGQMCRAVMVNTTERHEREKALRLAATVFSTVDDAVIVTDRENKIITANPAFTDITGYSIDEVIGKDPRILASGRHPAEFYREMWETLAATGSWQGEIWDRHKSGEIYVKWLSIKQVRDENGQLSHYVAISSDLTRRKATEEHIYHLAYYDTLTDLPNRMLLSDRLQQALITAKRDKARLAVMFLDLDEFKPVNDTFGHNVGDLLLKEVATRIQSCLRESDTAARVGGDEFIMLLPNIEGEQDAMVVAEKIRHALAQSYELAGHSLRISSSIGIAVYPENGSEEEVLLKNADTAMYFAKEGGRNRVCRHEKPV